MLSDKSQKIEKGVNKDVGILDQISLEYSRFHRIEDCQLWKNNVSLNRGMAKVSRHNGHDIRLPLWYVNHRREHHQGINVSMYRCLRRLACQQTHK